MYYVLVIVLKKVTIKIYVYYSISIDFLIWYILSQTENKMPKKGKKAKGKSDKKG